MPLPRFEISRGNLVIGLGTALALFAYAGLFHNALIDDAFITLNYVKSLTLSGTWGYFPGHVTNTATSPLNVLLLSVITLVTHSPLESVFWLIPLEWLLLFYFLVRIGRLLGVRWFAIIALVALVVNPLLSSTLGLESILFTLLITATIYFLLANRIVALGVAAALVTLTRPDGILLFGLVLAFVRGWRTRFYLCTVFALVLAPWYLYSWLVLGSLIPDTFLIKVRQSWGSIAFAEGLRLYFRRYPLEVALSFALAPLAFLVLIPPVRKIGTAVWILVAYGILHFAAYAVLRVPPYHWYYVPEVTVLALLGALGVAKLLSIASLTWQRTLAVVLAGLALFVPLGGTGYLILRQGVPLHESFIATNWATQEQYQTIGLYLKQHYAGKTIPTNGEPGTIAYYCDCFVLDYAFNVRDWLSQEVATHRRGTRLMDWFYRFNYHFFGQPAPYPPPAASLQVFTVATKPPEGDLPYWFTATRWVKAGLVVLHEHD